MTYYSADGDSLNAGSMGEEEKKLMKCELRKGQQGFFFDPKGLALAMPDLKHKYGENKVWREHQTRNNQM